MSDSFSILVYTFMLWTPHVYERDVLTPQSFLYFPMYNSISLNLPGELGVSSCLVSISLLPQ
jgi:hypothetical protein